MGRDAYKLYCIAVIVVCTLFNLSSCSSSGTGNAARGWGSSSSSGGWSSGSEHK